MDGMQKMIHPSVTPELLAQLTQPGALPILFTADPRFPEGTYFSSMQDVLDSGWHSSSAEFGLTSNFFCYNKAELLIQTVPGITLPLKGVLHINELTVLGQHNGDNAADVQTVLDWWEGQVTYLVDRIEREKQEQNNAG
jgi:hypothetical protein